MSTESETNNPVLADCPDILRWSPPTWDHFIGNSSLKSFLKALLRSLRKEIAGETRARSRPSFLVTGPSRSGKTAMITFFLRCLACKMLDMETLNPCDRRCETCKLKLENYGDTGIFAYLRERTRTTHLHFLVIDATKIVGPADLQEKLRELREYDGIRIVYIDEVHRLVARAMDEALLTEIEQKGFIWIFSTAKPQGLEDMFLNRLHKVCAELPATQEMEQWLVDRCDDFGLDWESNAVMRVVEKSNRVVGTSLHALDKASLFGASLTLDLVENNWNVQLPE